MSRAYVYIYIYVCVPLLDHSLEECRRVLLAKPQLATWQRGCHSCHSCGSIGAIHEITQKPWKTHWQSIGCAKFPSHNVIISFKLLSLQQLVYKDLESQVYWNRCARLPCLLLCDLLPVLGWVEPRSKWRLELTPQRELPQLSNCCLGCATLGTFSHLNFAGCRSIHLHIQFRPKKKSYWNHQKPSQLPQISLLQTSFKSSKFHSSWINIILFHERCGHFGHFALPFGHFNESNESISEAASAMSTRMSDVTKAVESPGRFGKRHEPLQPSWHQSKGSVKGWSRSGEVVGNWEILQVWMVCKISIHTVFHILHLQYDNIYTNPSYIHWYHYVFSHYQPVCTSFCPGSDELMLQPSTGASASEDDEDSLPS